MLFWIQGRHKQKKDFKEFPLECRSGLGGGFKKCTGPEQVLDIFTRKLYDIYGEKE